MRKIGLAALAGLFWVTAAEATPITRTFDVTSDHYAKGLLHHATAPVDPVTMSITVTFDPGAGDVTDKTTGITLGSTNLTLDASPIAFSYVSALDQLLFGLMENGGVNGISPSANDFGLTIVNPGSAAPFVLQAAYSKSTPGDLYTSSKGTVSFTTAAVPEPASLALLLSALAGCGFLARRRRPVAGG